MIWYPRELPIRGHCFEDDPFIKVEFALQSKDGRMTLVLTEHGTVVRSLWGLMDCTDIEKAKEALFIHEGITTKEPNKYIGSLLQSDQPKEEEFMYCDGFKDEINESKQEKQRRIEHRIWLKD